MGFWRERRGRAVSAKNSPGAPAPARVSAGYGLIELLFALAAVASLAGIALPEFVEFKRQAQNAQAIAELQTLNNAVHLYYTEHGRLPDSLAQVGNGSILDPWQQPYRYLKIDGNSSAAQQAKKDLFLIVINSDYDLYSTGRDGRTSQSVSSSVSQDDPFRANDGGYFGLVANY